MVIKTTRFGQVAVETEDLISFPDGILGFADLKQFVLLDDPKDDIFAWLQSCAEPSIAFPVLEPELFVEKYQVHFAKSDLDALKANSTEKLGMISIVTIPEDPTKMTANLKAPIVINRALRIARQCVLQDNNWAIREPIFVKLQQRVVQNPTEPIKNGTQIKEVTVRLEKTRNSEADL